MECVEEVKIINLFMPGNVKEYRTIDSSRGEEDFRTAIIATMENGEKLVVKLACNSFTTPESIQMWQRCTEEYIRLGYYCPRIFASKNGDFPTVEYKGHKCIAYAEEYSKYGSADKATNAKPYCDELYIMTARVAAQRFDYTDIPSGYTLFIPYPGDPVDEVTENALDFKEYSKKLPECFAEQTERMFKRWEENYKRLKEVYFKLPFSVFQADLNDTNVLLDGEGRFVGVYDFNIAGKDEFLNYLFREIFEGSFDEEREEILRALKTVSGIYHFSDEEIMAAPLIYRCVKPLWFTRVDDLKSAGNDIDAIRACLDEMEDAQVREIDFESVMR